MAEISVIIPVYNAEKYIAGCLDALCAQTFGDIEVLCVDDGSTDGSGSILAEYAGKDPRIRVFSQANAGPAVARNLGLKNAGGRYVMFCDADDSYRPDCCERMLRTMTEKRPDVAVCRCRVEIEEVDTEARRHTVSESFYNAPYTGMHVLDDELRVKMSVVLWNKIFAKELIERYGICFPEGCEHDDDTFWMLYSLFAKDVYFLSERLYNYRIRVNSIMSNYFNKKPKNKYDRYRVCNFVYDFLQRKGLLEANLAAVSDFYRRQTGMMFFDLFTADELRKMTDEMNARQLDCLFAVRRGKIFSAPRAGLEEAGWGKLLKYMLLSGITVGRRKKMLKKEEKTVRSQLRMKKILKKAG